MAPVRVLLADDSSDLRELLVAYLSKKGFHVTAVAGGAEAFRRFKTEGFDIVLSDVQMPDGCGLNLLKQIRTVTNAVPVILMTAGQSTNADEATSLGADAFLTKPFPLGTLHQALVSYIPLIAG